jgi:endo-1,4-beta-xylanase
VPAAENSTGSAVVICLGGGHSKLCLGHEGYALAEWFKERGIATFVTDKKRTACGHGRTISWPDVF